MRLSEAFEGLKTALAPAVQVHEIDKQRDSLIVYGSDGERGVRARVGRPPRGQEGGFVVEGEPGFTSVVDAALRRNAELATWSTSRAAEGRLIWRVDESDFLERVAAGAFDEAMQIEPKLPLARAIKHVMLGELDLARAALRVAIDEGAGDSTRLLCTALVAQTAELTDVRVECLQALPPDSDPARQAEAQVQLAEAFAQLGDAERALSCVAELDVDALEDRGALLELLYSLGDFEGVRSRLRPGEDTKHAVRLALAEARYEEVAAWDSSAEIPLQRGAALICLGRVQEGRALVERANQCDEADVWLAEAELKAGVARRAERMAARVEARHGALAPHAVRMAATARVPLPDVLWSRWTRSNAVFEALRAGAFREFGDDVSALDSRQAARALFDSTLQQLGGTRSLPLTRWDAESGSLRLVQTSGSSREQSSSILRDFAGNRDSAAAEAAFERLQAKYPWSPFPWTYFGEMLLWLGRIEDGRAAFIQALKRSRTRWAFVGLSLCELLRGHPRRAKAASRLGVWMVGALPESTATGIEGEAEYELGNYRAAKTLLTEAVRTGPGRVGARTNLALTHLALGDREEAQSEWETVTAMVPALAEAAASSSLKETLMRFRDSLLGNRSSWFRSGLLDGEFQIFGDGSAFVPTAREIRRMAGCEAARPPAHEEQS